MTNANIILATKTHKCKRCGEKKPLDTFRRVFVSEDKQFRDFCIDCKTNIIYEQVYNKAEYMGRTQELKEKSLIKKILGDFKDYITDDGSYKNKEKWV